MAKYLPSLLLLISALLLNGCSWFSWTGLGDDEDDDATRMARAERVTAIQAANTDMGSPRGETMADRRLRDVFEKQEALYARLGNDGMTMADPEIDRLISEVITEYQSYLSDYPDSVHGFILYGKLLRDVGQTKDANKAFIRANQLDGNIAVVKQQIGNYLAEEGEPTVALAYYLSAAELAPNESVYAYQIGELLYTYRLELVAEQALEQNLLETQMIAAFAQAHELDPSNRQLAQRYAEAFYDISAPEWRKALLVWQALEGSATNPVERDYARLNEARVLMKLGRGNEARQILNSISQPGLQEARSHLLSELG